MADYSDYTKSHIVTQHGMGAAEPSKKMNPIVSFFMRIIESFSKFSAPADYALNDHRIMANIAPTKPAASAATRTTASGIETLRIPKSGTSESSVKAASQLSDIQRDDPNLISPLALKNPEALQYASERLKNDKQFMLDLLKFATYDKKDVLQACGEKLRNDPVFIKQATQITPLVLDIIGDKIKDHSSVAQLRAILCVKKDGMELQKMPEYQDDKEVALAAVNQNRQAFEHVGPNLKNDAEFLIQLYLKDRKIIDIPAFREKTKEHRELALKVLQDHPEIFKEFPADWQNDREFVEKAINKNAEVLEHVSDQFQNDRDFILNLIKPGPLSMKFARLLAKQDAAFILEAADKNPLVLHLLSEAQQNNRELIEKLVLKDPQAFRIASPELRSNIPFIKSLVEKGLLGILKHVRTSVKTDKNLLIEFLRNEKMDKGSIVKYFDRSVLNDPEVKKLLG